MSSFKVKRVAPVIIRRTHFVPGVIEMFRSAKAKCPHCNGTGWEPNYEERFIQRCSCVDPVEVVMGNK